MAGEEHDLGDFLFAIRAEKRDLAVLFFTDLTLAAGCAIEERDHAIKMFLLPIVDQWMVVAFRARDIDAEETACGVHG